MVSRREVMTQNLAERWYWQATGRDDARGAAVEPQQVIDGVYRLDEGSC